jgi:Domain of Unknown Function with PDB structure (DUF3857)
MICLGCAFLAAAAAWAQEPAAKPAEVPPAKKETPKPEEKAALPFQIALLETHVRFEANGDSRKDVHTIVKINDLAGARQFSRVGFEYDRAFQSVEIPLVKISHANGGTSEILPSAITDVVNPAVEKFPAYQDLRVKAVRILGLQEGDKLEYRVITTTTKPPLAPDFWLEHTFDRSGQVLKEDYELDLPNTNTLTIRIRPEAAAQSITSSGEGELKRTIYQWHLVAPPQTENALAPSAVPDVALSTFASWNDLAKRLDLYEKQPTASAGPVEEKARQLAESIADGRLRMEAYYRFVRTKIVTVDIPLDATEFQPRDPSEVLSSGYGSVLDKFALLHRMASNSGGGELRPVFIDDREKPSEKLPIPSDLVKMVAAIAIEPSVRPDGHGGGETCADCEEHFWLDIGLDVAPFGVVRPDIRGKFGLLVGRLAGIYNSPEINKWEEIPDKLPFHPKQTVDVNASISPAGELRTKVKYVMRGDNELLLREAFHQAPKEQWNEVAGLLALSDGFRGHIEKVTASDPMETEKPFMVEYEIAQPKFVDWAKKPVRIPALLPQIALPDAAVKTAGKIELGPPLDVETRLKLQLPAGTKVQTPAATSVARDYVTFASKYDAHLNTVTASRCVYFLKPTIPAAQQVDYNAFTRAVQLDQAQVITLFPAENAQKEKSSPQR